MSANFPAQQPPAGSANTTDTLADANHTALHNDTKDETRALGTKLGTGSSIPSSSTVLRGTGSGTSAWQQINALTDFSGGSSGTGRVILDASATINTPHILTPTITSGGSWAGSPTFTNPTLSSPTITNFSNANHNHSNSAGGGSIGNAAITGVQLGRTQSVRVYLSAAQSFTNGVETNFSFDTEDWDTDSFHNNTNPDRLTVPAGLSGVYYVVAFGVWGTNVTGARFARIFNGASQLASGYGATVNDPTGAGGINLSTLVYLNAGDYLVITGYQSSGGSLNSGSGTSGPSFSMIRLGNNS